MNAGPKKKKKRIILKVFLSLFVIVVIAAIVGGSIAYSYYNKIYAPNVNLHGKGTSYLFIHTGSTLDDVTKLLSDSNYVDNIESFRWVAGKKNLASHVYPGRYFIRNRMSNAEFIDLLRSGEQVPLNVVINPVRSLEKLAGVAASYLEADSISIINLLKDKEYIKKYGFDSQTIIGMFMTDTYEFEWNTSAEGFFERMAREYKNFWSEDRKQKAKNIGLSQNEVSTLASIVELETQKNDEKQRMAGVYMNRIKTGMKLQADPTLIYAIGDFSIKRVLNIHKEVDSPYNTYLYAGLPPGPIALPSKASLIGVLDYEKHDCFYFCAKEDFSGYHNFAKTYSQHLLNAKRYQKELDKRKIK